MLTKLDDIYQNILHKTVHKKHFIKTPDDAWQQLSMISANCNTNVSDKTVEA